MLVSHRNMISVYKMTQQHVEWQTHSFEGGFIRTMFIKKKSHESTQTKKLDALLPTETENTSKIVTVYDRY